jgi:putative transposase
MGAPKNRIRLKDDERKTLSQLAARYTEKHSIVKRAKIILMADQKILHKDIAEKLNVAKNTISTWTARWNIKTNCPIEERLQDLPRPGTPDKFTPEQLCQITAIACEAPKDHGLPITHWTYRELADEAVKQGIVASISPTYLGRILKKTI